MISSRKKGYYIYYISESGLSGVEKKVDSQMMEFSRYFDMEGIGIEKEKTNIIKSCMWRLPFGSYGRKYEDAFSIICEPNFIYIRFVPIDRRFFFFIRKLKNRFPNALLLLEIPTFPYKKELLYDWQMFPFYMKDKVYHRFLKKYIDRIVTFSDDKQIWGIPTIRVRNGINVESICPINSNRPKMNNTVRLLAVASLQKAHGYERLIWGLARYYQTKQERVIEIHIVGEGKRLNYYKKIVSQNHLEKYVFFYGRKTGIELDNIYENTDIALGAFGAYRQGLWKLSSLKIREYLAKGLPIISGCREDAFDNSPDCKYYLQVSNDSTIVDMKEILRFYDRVYCTGVSREKIIANIREFAKKEVDVAVTMQPIVEYIIAG